MRKDDCGEIDILTGRNMPLRFISDMIPSFLGHFRVGNGKSMVDIALDGLCFSVKDYSFEEIDRTCRNKNFTFFSPEFFNFDDKTGVFVRNIAHKTW